eukprot:1142310-Pelagomonas_calceolata.AAC.5
MDLHPLPWCVDEKAFGVWSAADCLRGASTAYQCHLCVRKDWLHQFFSVACNASLTCNSDAAMQEE